MLQIPEAVYDEMRRHGEESYPEECCGVLVGVLTDGEKRVSRVFRAGNANSGSAAAGSRYEIAPLEVVRILSAARRIGEEIVGFYHSHPDHAARWSLTDLLEAHWLGCSYVITAVEQGRAAATRSFHLEGTGEMDKGFEDEGIEVVA